jgi:hypothetical protein
VRRGRPSEIDKVRPAHYAFRAMTMVVAKMRLLSGLRRIFPEWAMRRQALVIEHAFDAELKSAKNDWEARQHLLNQREHETSKYWNALRAHRSRRLNKQAGKLHIDTSGLKWESDQYANYYLDEPSDLKLRREVKAESRNALEFRLKVIGGILAGAVALVTLFGKLGVSFQWLQWAAAVTLKVLRRWF